MVRERSVISVFIRGCFFTSSGASPHLKPLFKVEAPMLPQWKEAFNGSL